MPDHDQSDGRGPSPGGYPERAAFRQSPERRAERRRDLLRFLAIYAGVAAGAVAAARAHPVWAAAWLAAGGAVLSAAWSRRANTALARAHRAEAAVSAMRRLSKRNLARRRDADRQIARYRLFSEISRDIELLIRVSDGRIVAANAVAESVYGYSRVDLLQRTIADLREDGTESGALNARVEEAGPEGFYETRHLRRDGSSFPVEVRALEAEVNGERMLFEVIHDITVRMREAAAKSELERQLQEAQKLETIGRLAGGIAHDFNNLLQVILGNVESLESLVPGSGEIREGIQEIRRAGSRAAELTRQLLAFSRRQPLRLERTDLSVVVRETEPLIRRLLGEDITVRSNLAAGLRSVHADSGQVSQILMNLAANSRDAMPRGGAFSVELAPVHVEGVRALRHPEIPPSEYVLLTVSDTGTGMNDEVKAHLFEPFFTTKGVGQGTGLGLATVYGIMKQFGGHVLVYSEEGHGTSVKLYFSACDDPARPAQPDRPATRRMDGTETVLLAEDDMGVRFLAARALRAHGYTVLEAGSGAEALRVAGQYAEPIHILVTDMVMPGLGGQELAERVGKERPGLKTVLISGFSKDMVAQGAGLAERPFLGKPFAMRDLVRMVRKTLDGKAVASEGPGEEPES